MTIYVTPFDPATKCVTGISEDSGFTSLEEVTELMGEPLVSGTRTRTYDGVFYSNYSVTEFGQ